MVELIKTGAPNIVCIQPFACLPNHVVGKGVIKKLKDSIDRYVYCFGMYGLTDKLVKAAKN